VQDAEQEGLIKPILIGPKDRIVQAAQQAKIDISKYEILDTDNSHVAIQKAVQLARGDEIGLIIRGAAVRDDLLRAMQKLEKGILTYRVLSYATVLDVPTYPKALILTDSFINIEPNLDTKRGITQNAIDFAKALGINEPRVAILAGADTVSQSMRSTVDAAALCKMAERGQIKGAVIDGPLTFDNVISVEVSKSKGIVSPVVGAADILVVPNVETGNILAKQLEYLAESHNAGLVLGGRVPVLMSHINDTYLSTVSCALAILMTAYHSEQ
jgi:phosphate acetyltransferase/phosphate butyryltransferase